MTRRRLPNRRLAETFNLEVGGLHYVVSIGRFADGELAEIFISNGKAGIDSDTAARDSAVVASIALHYGVPLEVIRHVDPRRLGLPPAWRRPRSSRWGLTMIPATPAGAPIVLPPSAPCSFGATDPTAPGRPLSRDRAWWEAEVARLGTDWASMIETAIELLLAAGIIDQPEPDSMTAWDAPSWREAAVEYHRDRAGRLAVEMEPGRLARLRRLMEDDVTLDRAWHVINTYRPTPEVTIEAIKVANRDRGLDALKEPATQQRLRHCDADARARLDHWLADFRKRNCP